MTGNIVDNIDEELDKLNWDFVFSEAKRMQEEEDRLGEIYQSFLTPSGIYLAKYVKKILTERPDITDRDWVCAAADMMDDCKINGVELSVANALRLTEKRDKPMDTADLVKLMESFGITDDNFREVIDKGLASFDKELEELAQKDVNEDAVRSALLLERLGKDLAESNSDIVLLKVPNIEMDDGRLKLAFFTDEFTEDEQKTLYDMKLVSDRFKYEEKYGIGYATFYVDDLLK